MVRKASLLLLLCACMTLCSCTARESTDSQTCKSIADNIQTAAPFAELTDANESYLEKYLMIDASVLEAWVMRRDATRATPEMILVLQVKDKGQQAEIKQAVQDYHDEQLLQYRDYQPDQVFKLENAKVMEKDAFIVLAVSPDAAKTNAALGAGWK